MGRGGEEGEEVGVRGSRPWQVIFDKICFCPLPPPPPAQTFCFLQLSHPEVLFPCKHLHVKNRTFFTLQRVEKEKLGVQKEKLSTYVSYKMYCRWMYPKWLPACSASSFYVLLCVCMLANI